MKHKTVLLLGATGLVGGECLRRILEGNLCDQIVILTRRPLPDTLRDPRIMEHVIDFDQPESYRHLIKGDHLICAMGTTIKKAGTKENFSKVDFTYPHRIASIARENGAGHFLLVSANGANPNSLIFYNRVKGALETAVQNLGYRSVSIFRPSLLLGDRAEFRAGEKVGASIAKFVSFAIPERYKPVHAGAVAVAIVRAAQENRPGVRFVESDEMRALR